MSIWSSPIDLDELNQHNKDTAIERLGIEFIAYGEDWLQASMPVDQRTCQPYGLLHGGASVLLAETLGSLAAIRTLNTRRELAVGLDINANHLRGVRSGQVIGTARPLHLGRSTQVWEIRIEDAEGKLSCISRLTLAVVPASRIAS